jgi:CRP/FNR family transcriptional regulator
MEDGLCSTCNVRDTALCSILAEPDRAALNAISHHRHFEKGAVVMWAGDESLACGTLVSGLLELSASARDGRKQIFGLLYPSDFVGQPSAGLTPFSVTALTDCRLCLYPRAAFERLLDDHLAMERLLLRRTMAALDIARARMLLLSRGTAGEKLASFLLEMADRLGAANKDQIIIDLPLSRGQIADLLGLTVETVSRQMTHFRAAGHIDLPGGRGLIIRDRAALDACTMDAA